MQINHQKLLVYCSAIGLSCLLIWQLKNDDKQIKTLNVLNKIAIEISDIEQTISTLKWITNKECWSDSKSVANHKIAELEKLLKERKQMVCNSTNYFVNLKQTRLNQKIIEKLEVLHKDFVAFFDCYEINEYQAISRVQLNTILHPYCEYADLHLQVYDVIPLYTEYINLEANHLLISSDGYNILSATPKDTLTIDLTNPVTGDTETYNQVL